MDSSERSVRLPEYGTGNEASGVQLVGGSNESRPFFTAPFHSVFPSHSNVFGECAPISNTRDNTSGVFLRKSVACRARESENFLCPSQPLSWEGNTGAYPKHPFPGGSEPHDSIHFESEAESNFINIHDRFSRIDSLHGLLRRLSGDLTDCICLQQGKSYLL